MFGRKKLIVPLLLSAILIFSFAVRFYKLGEVPNGLNNDETAIGYNAYSIGQTGRDEYGVFMPLYFRSFDDYKLPVYIYMTSFTEKIFGVNAFAVRFPSMFFGVLTVLLVFILTKELSKRSDLAILAGFLLAINPWHIFFSRIAFEVNVATAFAVLGTTFFVFAIKNKINYILLFLSIISFTISIYSYNVARIVSLLILLMLFLINFKRISKIPKIILILFGLFAIGLLSPFILTLTSHSGFANQQGVFIAGFNAQASALEFRSYFFSLPLIYSKLFFNSFTMIVLHYLKNVFGFLSFDFFFINGANNPINGVGNFGMFYFLELPFIVTGLFIGIKKRVSYLVPFYLWMLIVILLTSFMVEVPHATRTYMIIIPFVIFSAYGALSIYNYLSQFQKRISYTMLGVCGILFTYLIIYYLSNYFIYFPARFAKTWREEDKKVVDYIIANNNKYQKYIFDKNADFAYTSLLFYIQYPPSRYQKNAVYKKDGLLSTLAKVDNYEFESIDWNKDFSAKGPTLIIINPDDIGKNAILKTFNLPERPVVNVTDKTIVVYPYSEPVYRLVEKF